MTSFDGAPDWDVETTWDLEILRRLAEVEAGTANLIDRKEFRRRIRASQSAPHVQTAPPDPGN
jgi:hypothetical protein